MAIDFTRLENEYNSYWSNGSLQQAIQLLASLNDQMDGNFLTLYDANQAWQPNYLAPLYASMTYQNVVNVINNVSYKDMVIWYQGYIHSQIEQIQDENKKLIAIQNQTLLDNLLQNAFGTSTGNIVSGISSGIGGLLSNPMVLLAIVAIFVVPILISGKEN